MANKFIADRLLQEEVPLMSKLAGMTAGMDDLIDLSIGDPDFTTPAPIIEAGYKDALAGCTHYTQHRGYPDVIQAVVDYYKRELGVVTDEKNVLITTSADYAAFQACFATINPGDEVLIPDPSFLCYRSQVEYSGGKSVMVPTYEEDGWRLKAEIAEKYVTPRTRGIFISTPNNPTGACMHKEDLEGIVRLAEKYDLLIYSDEIYTWYSYDVPFVSVLSIPGAAERTVVINSMSKNYVCTGARLAWVIAPVQIIGAMVQEGMNMVYTAPSISQRMGKFALEQGKEVMAPIMAEFKERMFKTAERINQIPHLKVQSPPPGTFYLFVNVKETGLTDEEFVLKVLQDAHVVTVPGSNFGACGKGYVRFCATVGLPKLLEACDRIEKLGL
ncbi:MAG: aminotransferase class I/II-fold pyridoxal phosphate-dependent enzyme [Firmicutes bacterium]|nr:aminotransferase class I/II-fold pyridoxal phosphate-dependent enzyme [Bacillota bacterium]